MDTLTIAFVLIAVGLVLMGAELFFPTHGVLFGLGVGMELIGAVLTFDYGLTTGLATLVGLMVLLPIGGSVLLSVWQKSSAGRRLILTGTDDDNAVANLPATIELERLRGQFGRTLSALRPCGSVDFNGQRVDTMTDGGLIAPNQWVRCVDIRGGRVIVRQAPEPPNLENMDTEILKPG
jgi:membrane-bound serine protease (ClpP class)